MYISLRRATFLQVHKKVYSKIGLVSNHQGSANPAGKADKIDYVEMVGWGPGGDKRISTTDITFKEFQLAS